MDCLCPLNLSVASEYTYIEKIDLQVLVTEVVHSTLNVKKELQLFVHVCQDKPAPETMSTSTVANPPHGTTLSTPQRGRSRQVLCIILCHDTIGVVQNARDYLVQELRSRPSKIPIARTTACDIADFIRSLIHLIIRRRMKNEERRMKYPISLSQNHDIS